MSARKPWPLPPARWPSAAEARASRLFSPGGLGPVRTRTRTWVPAMVPWRAGEDGAVNENVLAWYGRFAAGRPGVLVVEATGIRDLPSGPLLRIGDDRFVPGLARLVRRVASASGGTTRLLIQLLDFLRIRRRRSKEEYFARFFDVTERHRRRLASTRPELAEASDSELRRGLAALPDDELERILDGREWRDLRYGYRETVNDVHLPWIAELPEILPGLFAAAARRAEAAGFDGVELHFAHAYTMAGFLSRTNRRRDGYGRSLAGRRRLALEVLAAVRAAVGRGFAVGCRLLADEVIRGGSRIEDAVAHARALAEAGIDFVSVSKGGKFEDAKAPRVGEAAYPYTGPSGRECMPDVRIAPPGPFGRNVPLAARIRRALRDAGLATPVVAAGGICSFDQAEGILARGEADFVAAARQSLADPDWWWKVEQGRGAEVRRCTYTNYCEGLDRRHKEVTCKLWDRLPPAPGERPPMSRDGRRRLLPPRWNAGATSPHEEER